MKEPWATRKIEVRRLPDGRFLAHIGASPVTATAETAVGAHRKLAAFRAEELAKVAAREGAYRLLCRGAG